MWAHVGATDVIAAKHARTFYGWFRPSRQRHRAKEPNSQRKPCDMSHCDHLVQIHFAFVRGRCATALLSLLSI